MKVNKKKIMEINGSQTLEKNNIITGIVKLHNKKICIVYENYNKNGYAFEKKDAYKINSIQNVAYEKKIPIVYIIDSVGADLNEGVDALHGYGQVFQKCVNMSGVVPQIVVILGNCCGGASYLAALADIVFCVKDEVNIFITGPRVVEDSIGEKIDTKKLGGEIHYKCNGIIDCIYDKKEEMFRDIIKVTNYFINSSKKLNRESILNTSKLKININNIVPKDFKKIYDIKNLILQVVDKETFFELGCGYAKNIIVGFAEIAGKSVGIVANQPLFKCGGIDCEASKKAARFIRMCDCFSIPIITFVDTPGFIPGYEQEKRGITVNGSKIIFAYANAKVLKISVIVRKAYGGAYIAMNSKGIGADKVFSWPNVETGIMAAENAVKILKERKFTVDEYKRKYIDVSNAVKKGIVDEIILPENTRIKIIEVIRNEDKRYYRKKRKRHGNMRL